MSVSEAGASRVVSEEAGVVSSSGQREIDGVIVAGPSGILDRLERVECNRAALPVNSVRRRRRRGVRLPACGPLAGRAASVRPLPGSCRVSPQARGTDFRERASTWSNDCPDTTQGC